jgi:hypothetical protein
MTLRLLFAVSLLAGSASAAQIFLDTFDTSPTGLNVAPAGWTQSNGTVDTFPHGFLGLPCLGGAGRCVDLDGSTSNAGVLTSNTTFALMAGATYTLSYWLAGSQRGDSNTVTVSLGGVSVSHTLPSAAPYAQFSLVVMPAVNLAGQAIVFDHAGGDNLGLLLDSVALDESTAGVIPEPSTMVLLAGALAALALARKR